MYFTNNKLQLRCLGICKDKQGNALQLHALRYFLVVHCKAPSCCGWVTVKFEHYCKLWNCIFSLENERLPKINQSKEKP